MSSRSPDKPNAERVARYLEHLYANDRAKASRLIGFGAWCIVWQDQADRWRPANWAHRAFLSLSSEGRARLKYVAKCKRRAVEAREQIRLARPGRLTAELLIGALSTHPTAFDSLTSATSTPASEKIQKRHSTTCSKDPSDLADRLAEIYSVSPKLVSDLIRAARKYGRGLQKMDRLENAYPLSENQLALTGGTAGAFFLLGMSDAVQGHFLSTLVDGPAAALLDEKLYSTVNAITFEHASLIGANPADPTDVISTALKLGIATGIGTYLLVRSQRFRRIDATERSLWALDDQWNETLRVHDVGPLCVLAEMIESKPDLFGILEIARRSQTIAAELIPSHQAVQEADITFSGIAC